MGENFQKSELPTFLQFVRVGAAYQPHVVLNKRNQEIAINQQTFIKNVCTSVRFLNNIYGAVNHINIYKSLLKIMLAGFLSKCKFKEIF